MAKAKQKKIDEVKPDAPIMELDEPVAAPTKMKAETAQETKERLRQERRAHRLAEKGY